MVCYLLCYTIFSTSEEICFTPQETKECVHKLVEGTGKGDRRRVGKKKQNNETRSFQGTSCLVNSLYSVLPVCVRIVMKPSVSLRKHPVACMKIPLLDLFFRGGIYVIYINSVGTLFSDHIGDAPTWTSQAAN